MESPISRTSVRNSFNYHFTGKKNNSTFEHSIITCRAVETWTIINMKINKARLINGITDFADVIYRYHWRLINSREGQRFFRWRKVVKTLENSRATGVIIIISIWHGSKMMMIEVSFQTETLPLKCRVHNSVRNFSSFDHHRSNAQFRFEYHSVKHGNAFIEYR